MGVKLEDKYIKNKLKAKFGELEVYNPIDKNVYAKLSKMIQDNSKQISLENGKSDIQVDNTIQIMRQLLSYCSNIESEEYWNNISNNNLENMLNLADGDFKQVVNSLLDIMIEIGQDIRVQSRRQLDILNSKIEELGEVLKFNVGIDKKLAEFGLDRDKLNKLQQGDESTIEEFQKKLIDNSNKPKKRGRPKKEKIRKQ